MAQAKSRSGNLSTAGEKLRVRQSEILTKLASKYTRELATELISVTDAIEVVDEMIRKEGSKPAASRDSREGTLALVTWLNGLNAIRRRWDRYALIFNLHRLFRPVIGHLPDELFRGGPMSISGSFQRSFVSKGPGATSARLSDHLVS